MGIEIFQEKSFLRKPFLLNHQKCFNNDHGVFRKEETKGYLNMKLKRSYKCMLLCIGLVLKLPQNSIFLEIPQPTPTPTRGNVLNFFLPLYYTMVCVYMSKFSEVLNFIKYDQIICLFVCLFEGHIWHPDVHLGDDGPYTNVHSFYLTH